MACEVVVGVDVVDLLEVVVTSVVQPRLSWLQHQLRCSWDQLCSASEQSNRFDVVDADPPVVGDEVVSEAAVVVTTVVVVAPEVLEAWTALVLAVVTTVVVVPSSQPTFLCLQHHSFLLRVH